MKNILFVLGLGITLPLLSVGAVASAARSDTTVRLNITPTLCIVDVTQDGTSQLIQTPSSGCEAALPLLLTDAALSGGKTNPLFALPFAGREPQAQQPIIRQQVEGTLVPIASKTDQASSTNTNTIAMTMTGVGLAIAAVAVGIDIALFELHYSRSLAKWTHAKTTARVFKK